jgi:F-type H+-transporting ATPase subunit epsilon
LFVEGGFAEVTAERCTVLAEEAMLVEDLSSETAEERRQTAITVRDAASDDAGRAAAEQQILIADAMLAAVEAKGRGARA